MHLAIRASSVPTTPPWKCLRLMYFRWSLIEAKIRPYHLFDCPSLSCKLSISHFTVITWLQRGRRSDEIQCWSKKDHFHGQKNNTILTVSEWVMRIFHPLVVKTCMFLPAVKSVVKRGTNPMPLFKDMEDSPRLTTDYGQTLIGFVPRCAILIQYCQRWKYYKMQHCTLDLKMKIRPGPISKKNLHGAEQQLKDLKDG